MIVAMLISLGSYAQEPGLRSEDTTEVNNLLQQSKELAANSPEEALSLANKARNLSTGIGFKKGEAKAYKSIGMVYYYKGEYVQTLENWNLSLKLLEEVGDENGIANMLSNIGAVYANQGDDVRALDHHLRSLRLSEKTGDKLRILSALNNIGSVYYEKKATWDKALDYLLRALQLAEDLGDSSAISVLSGNVGEIYSEKGDKAKAIRFYDQSLRLGAPADDPFALNGLGKVYLQQGSTSRALLYHNQALDFSRRYNENHLVPSLQGVAVTYLKMKDYNKAFAYLNEAELVAVKLKSYPGLKELYQNMANAYAERGNYGLAFRYQQKLDGIKDTLFNEITQKKLGSLQFEFDLQKKEGEITLLTKDKALKEADLKRQRVAKNAFAAGVVFLFAIAFIIYRNYRNKVKTNQILDHQKQEIEHLLLNILPAEVAEELQTKGKATPRNYSDVSVLFTDFKGFTTIADKMSPGDLVEELNACFIAFDEIIGRNKLEKIKTIGDSYMCAGGIPTEDENHIYNIVKASLEIQQYIRENNERRVQQGRAVWDIRIGIHTGPIVAGVVGKRKYAYDIWGSTVNIASRMESNGVPGQVNISAAVYERVKGLYNCTYRGKIYAKNVGEIDMYLIDHNIERYEEKSESRQRQSNDMGAELMAG